MASESGSSTDSHAETPESKDGELLHNFLYFFCFSSQSDMFSVMVLVSESTNIII